MQIVSSTKNAPRSPGFVEALKHSHGRKTVDLNLFKHPLPSHSGVNDEFIPNSLLDLGLVPLSMVEHFIITLNPNGPKRSAPKEVPNFDHFTKLFGDPFPKHHLFPIKVIIVARFNPTKFMHNECGPSPCPPSLDTIPKFVFDRFTSIQAGKKHTVWRLRPEQCEPSIH